jgi:hypothetical protein
LKAAIHFIFLLLVVNTVYGQYESDSIRWNHNRDITYHKRKIDLNMTSHIMSKYPGASNEIKKALTIRKVARILTGVAISIAAIPLIELLEGEEKPAWFLTGVSAGILTMTIHLQSAKFRRTDNAIKIYNSEINK